MAKHKTTYETLIRGKSMFDGCKTIKQMVERCGEMAAVLAKLDADKLRVYNNEVTDDYAVLVTTDEVTAKKYHMHPMEM